mmetsp:Transcript_39548/g.86142  ORF Transcript_39548/g.86142 Transcript_39548/m.86142 type:complete len:218 (+) Transcript_39548:560-1213(+)
MLGLTAEHPCRTTRRDLMRSWGGGQVCLPEAREGGPQRSRRSWRAPAQRWGGCGGCTPTAPSTALARWEARPGAPPPGGSLAWGGRRSWGNRAGRSVLASPPPLGCQAVGSPGTAGRCRARPGRGGPCPEARQRYSPPPTCPPPCRIAALHTVAPEHGTTWWRQCGCSRRCGRALGQAQSPPPSPRRARSAAHSKASGPDGGRGHGAWRPPRGGAAA